MRALVLGGTGFIGSLVVRQLLAAGHDVAALHRGRTTVPPGAHPLVGDRAAPQQLQTLLASYAPDTLVDMIAYTETDATQLLAALPPSLQRLVLISSGDVYSAYGDFLGQETSPSEVPVVESSPLRSQFYPYRAEATSTTDLRYSYDKILVERWVQEHASVPVTTLRLPMVYGPHDPHRRASQDLERIPLSAGTIRLHPAEAAWRCTRGYVEDVAQGIALAATESRAIGQTYNLGEPDAPTQQDWLALLGRMHGWSGAIIVDPSVPPSHAARWTASLVVSTQRIRDELGYAEAVGRVEGLRRTLAADAG